LRLQLAGELRRAGPRELVVLEHPEGGGHPRDLEQLVQILDRLCEGGSAVWVETHHPALLESADWIVEVGAGRVARSEARV
jgi:excinuclease ABC subunit A